MDPERNGWLYLAAVVDWYLRKADGWAMTPKKSPSGSVFVADHDLPRSVGSGLTSIPTGTGGLPVEAARIYSAVIGG